ncbi:MAG TPA: SUMF1/EgtB/PvdO family nonheme iron enzyme, partial [Ardenticatenaceae bacterium]|nr:SUMF1/EgtB/PvdO family nonheme iron enzyme [Ardenticatenaceae bacterium]
LAPRLATLALEGLAAERRDRVLVEAVRELWLEEPGAAELTERLEDALTGGQAALFFDGLDEVPAALRPRVRQAVQAVVREYPRVERVVVTSRIRSYVGEAVLPAFDSHTLAPFDGKKIEAFVRAWYAAQAALGRLTDEMAGERADDLTSAATSADLSELASNPMLLTTMAIIHQREVGLPRERVRLYSLAVQVLLSRWQQHKGIGVSERLAALLRDDLKLRAVLERLAYAAHEHQATRGEVTDLPRGDLLILLEAPDALGNTEVAVELLDYIDQRAGLLVGRGGDEHGGQPQVYTFPHRSFQEYLAGCRMVGQRGTAREYWQRAGEGDVWYLAARLVSEELLYNRRITDALLVLAYALCPAEEPATAQQWRAALWSGQMAPVLGEEEIRRDTAQPGGGDSYLQRLVPRLARALHTDALAAIERADAGRARAQLGDPRREAVTVEGMEFCYIPGGTFVMGSGEDDPDAWDDEKPQHACGMPNGYWLGRYPVTVAQYQAFVVGGGYSEGRYWAEAERAGVWHDGLVKGWLDDTERSGPADYGEPFSLPNHPVVGVTWYEALAFTRWLGAWLREGGGLPEGWEVTLPSEAEWELAARGAEMIPLRAVAATPAESLTASPSGELEPNPQPRRRFPWGDEASAERANYAATGIGTTSAVGCFPGGASVYGVEELSGNVWEWTRSVWGPYPSPAERPESRTGEDPERMFEPRVLRGGAFSGSEGDVRCAARYGNDPGIRIDDVGFRVAVSPSTSGL